MMAQFTFKIEKTEVFKVSVIWEILVEAAPVHSATIPVGETMTYPEALSLCYMFSLTGAGAKDRLFRFPGNVDGLEKGETRTRSGALHIESAEQAYLTDQRLDRKFIEQLRKKEKNRGEG